MTRAAAASLFVVLAGASALHAQELQFKVPYQCSGGLTVIIDRCETGERGEFCFFTDSVNGVERSPSYGRRPNTLAHVKGCQPPPPGTPQLLNPAYLSEMPAASRVEREIAGTDAVDATARRMGALWQLREMIYTLAVSQGRNRTIATADEKRLADAYAADHNRVAASLQQSLASTPDGARRYTELRRYTEAPEIRDQLLSRFFTPPFVQRYVAADAPYAARLRSIVAAEMAKEVTPVGRGASEQVVARCLAAGRPALQCVGAGIGNGLSELLGAVNPSLVKKSAPGLRLGGAFPGAGGFAVKVFGQDAALLGCNGLAQFFDYTLARQGNEVLVDILPPGQPPIALRLLPDGRLDGRGAPIVVADTFEVGQSVEKTSRGTLTTHYLSTKTERCTVGVLGPAAPPEEGFASAFLDASQRAINDSPLIKPAPGLRITGQYTGATEFSLEFFLDSVVVGCGQAVIARPYTVRRQGGQFVVTIDHGGTAIPLTLLADGRLQGSGPIAVRGRVLRGRNAAGDLVFEPAAATCTIGALSAPA